jgi:hypothetical protein
MNGSDQVKAQSKSAPLIAVATCKNAKALQPTDDVLDTDAYSGM